MLIKYLLIAIHIHRGYYTAARRYARVSKVLFLTRENKIHIFKPPCNFLLRERAGNDVINILIREDMENTPLGSRMQFRVNFTSGVFSSKTLLSI